MKTQEVWLDLMTQHEGKQHSLIYIFFLIVFMIIFELFSDLPELLLGLDGASGGLKNRFAPEASGLRPSRAAAVEQWARQSSGHAPRLSAASSNSIQRRGSDSLGKYSVPIKSLGSFLI